MFFLFLTSKDRCTLGTENGIVDVSINYLKLILVMMPNVRDIEGSIWVEILVRTLLALIFM